MSLLINIVLSARHKQATVTYYLHQDTFLMKMLIFQSKNHCKREQLTFHLPV